MISGQGTSTITFTNPTSANAGDYDVVVSGTCSPSATSSPTVALTVNPLPVISLSTSYICLGSVSTILSPTSGGTWISHNPSVATVTDAGVVSAVDVGNVTFTFTTSDATGCSNTTSNLVVDGSCQVVTLTQPAALSATITQDGVTTICSGDATTILVSVSGGTAPYTINGQTQSGNGPFMFTVSPTNTTTFDFSNIIVSDAHNCTSTTTGNVTINVNHAPVFDACPSNQVVSASGTCDAVVNYTATVQEIRHWM